MGGLCEAERALNFILRELWGTTVEWCKSQEAGREVRSQVQMLVRMCVQYVRKNVRIY